MEYLGITISRVDAAQIEVANDAVSRATGVFTGLGNQLAVSFSPIIAGVADSFRQSALDSAEFGDVGQRVADAVVRGFAQAADVVHNLKIGFLTAKETVLGFGAAVIDKLVPALQVFIDVYNSIADVIGLDLIASNPLQDFLAGINSSIAETKAQLAQLGSEEMPSAGIEAFYEKVKAKTRETAEAISKDAPAKVILDDLETNAPAILERLTFNQEQQIEGEKRLAAFKQKSGMAQTGQVVGELANQFSAIASNNKKLFAVNKAFQIGQAIMQTYSAATLALASYPPPLGFIMAAGAVVNGLGQVAQIRSQSFEGGGFTGRGARAGGLDGKGGYMAMVHPNESVIDHTKGGGGGVTIINNIDATGGADVDMKIRQAVTQATNASVATIQDLMRRRRFA